MPPELEAKIDAWIERQGEPKPSRSEAIRRLIESGLNEARSL
jgi:metal-responsive CopG/Arc/MetJ family transcriptional regulator